MDAASIDRAATPAPTTCAWATSRARSSRPISPTRSWPPNATAQMTTLAAPGGAATLLPLPPPQTPPAPLADAISHNDW